MAEALYRKYRPQVFEDVVGQEPIERTLKNAISQDKVSHAYLFTGPRGTGKTTTARLLAKALLCGNGPTPDPDGTCEDCQLIAGGVHPDVYELDAASRTGVENVREEIISRVHFAPTRGRYKVYIIDEVHMLSTAAFNALLKTLEEPPSHVVFILCTTDPQKVPETIHSRCQRFDFHRISPESMVARLGAICIAEEVEFEGEALDLIAQRAEGGLRNALTSLEQIIAFENGKVTLAGAERLLGSIDSSDLVEIMTYIGKRDIANCFRWTARYVETGADLAQFTRDMAEHVRNLYVMAFIGDDAELDVAETARQQLASELSWFGPDRAARLLGVLGDLMATLKTTSNPRLAFEVALTRMVRPDSDLTLEALAERIEALESGYSSVAHVLPGNPVVSATAEAQMPIESHASTPESSDMPRLNDVEPSLQAFDDAGIADIESAAEAVKEHPLEHDGADKAKDNLDNHAHAEIPPTDNHDERESENESPNANAARGSSRASSLSNPAALQRIWQAVLADVKKQKQSHGVLFMSTKAAFDEPTNTLVVRFPAESDFVFNAAQKPNAQDALANALVKEVGEPVAFRFVKGQGTNQTAAYSPAVASNVNHGFAGETTQNSTGEELATSAPPTSPTPDEAPTQSTTSELNATAQPVATQPVTAQPVTAQPAPVSSSTDAPRATTSDVTPEALEPTVTSQSSEPTEAPAINSNSTPPMADIPPYEEVPYEEVPYEDAPYDEVPYEEIDAGTQASPDSHLNQNGALEEDTAALQAMLQASFGEGVVLSETDE